MLFCCFYYAYSQPLIEYNFLKRIINENNSIELLPLKKYSPFEIIYNQKIYLNSNLPNLENLNGIYIPKGYGVMTSALVNLNYNNLSLSVEPIINNYKEFPLNLPEKQKYFSVLNDVPLKESYKNNLHRFINTGIKYKNKHIALGYGNWNRWWGPGIHNSLVMSNNAQGFYHYFIGTNDYQTIINNVQYKFEYILSNSIKNYSGVDFFNSLMNLNIRYNNIEFGFSTNVLSGGYNDISWGFKKAAQVIFSNENMKYWDQLFDYYILYNNKSSGIMTYFEYAYPNRSYGDVNPEGYNYHSSSSIIGVRKYRAFNSKKIMFGLEYARLVQGIYYNILPTPNWYDNIKYNYSSYNNRRWGAHSGTDSDDLFVFIGLLGSKINFVYGINYERHGVTFHFPPEVKIESKIHTSIKYKNTNFSLIFENEYFEHYGFVDQNINVWTQTFEKGSIQRTHTLLFSIEHSMLK